MEGGFYINSGSNSILWTQICQLDSGDVLWRQLGHVLRNAQNLRLNLKEGKGGGHGRGRWKMNVWRLCLSKEDELCQSRWIAGIDLIATSFMQIWPPSLVADTTELPLV